MTTKLAAFFGKESNMSQKKSNAQVRKMFFENLI